MYSVGVDVELLDGAGNGCGGNAVSADKAVKDCNNDMCAVGFEESTKYFARVATPHAISAKGKEVTVLDERGNLFGDDAHEVADRDDGSSVCAKKIGNSGNASILCWMKSIPAFHFERIFAQ